LKRLAGHGGKVSDTDSLSVFELALEDALLDALGSLWAGVIAASGGRDGEENDGQRRR